MILSSIKKRADSLSASFFRGRIPCFLVALFLISLLARILLFWFYFHNIPPGAFDAKLYKEVAAIWLAGNVPTLAEAKARWFYPLFLALHYRIFGTSDYPVLVTQAILSSCIVVITFLIALETVRRKGAYVASFMGVVYFNEMQWAFYILTDTLSLFLLSLVIYFFIRFSEKNSHRDLIAGGLILGLNTLIRPDSAIFVPAILVWYIFHSKLPKPLHTPWRVLLLCLAVAIVLFILVGPYLTNLLFPLREVFSLGIQWETWQRQDRRGGFPSMYDKSWQEIAQFIVQHSDTYTRFAWEKFVATWLVPVRPGYGRLHAIINLIFYPLVVFAIIFTTIEWIRGGEVNQRIFPLLLGLWLSKTLFIMVTFIDWDFRYRLPVDFIALICLAHLLDRALSFIQRNLPTTIRNSLCEIGPKPTL